MRCRCITVPRRAGRVDFQFLSVNGIETHIWLLCTSHPPTPTFIQQPRRYVQTFPLLLRYLWIWIALVVIKINNWFVGSSPVMDFDSFSSPLFAPAPSPYPVVQCPFATSDGGRTSSVILGSIPWNYCTNNCRRIVSGTAAGAAAIQSLYRQ